MEEKEKYLGYITKYKNGETIVRDPQLIAFMVRDWEYTKSAGLHDLAWAMCRDAYVSKNDALFLLDELEKHIKGGSEL